MTRTKWLTSFLALGLLAFGAALLQFRGMVDQTARESVAPPPPPPSAPASPPSVTASSFRSGPPMKRVMDLYESESKRVGQVDPDPKATQARLEEDAKELTPEEIRWLEGQTADVKNDADARFFASYLLGLSHKEASVAALGRIAASPLPKSKNERLNEQERALRASAIEGFCHSCGEFPAAVKDTALDVVSNQPDEFLSDRAHRCLYACQYGKSIENQDKEALRKLRQ